MKKLVDSIIIINAKQVVRSIKMYWIKHKVIFTFVYNHSKYSSWHKNLDKTLGSLKHPQLQEYVHIGNSHYCLCDSGFIKQIKIIMQNKIKWK